MVSRFATAPAVLPLVTRASSVDDASCVLTSYLVASAIVLPISGWLSSLFGRKRFYQRAPASE